MFFLTQFIISKFPQMYYSALAVQCGNNLIVLFSGGGTEDGHSALWTSHAH